MRLSPALCLAALLGLLAGCDLPSDPPALNPYDPAFDGPRLATAPSDLHVTASSVSSITLGWTDNSSFESGVRVERAYVLPFQTTPSYETVAVLPPDATSYTEAVEITTPRRYRIVAIVAGGTESAPSPALRLDYPAERRLISGSETVAASTIVLSPDARTLYAEGRTRTYALDVRTGQLIGAYGGASQISGFLSDGRIAVGLTAEVFPPVVRVYRGFALTAPYTLPQSVCQTGESQRIAVSGDGLRAIAACLFSSNVGIWTLASSGAPRLVQIATSTPGGSGDVAGISPDGRIALGGNDRETVAFDATDGRTLWRVPESISSSALSPDSRRVFTSTTDRLSLRDASTGTVLVSAAGNAGNPAFSPDGSRIGYPVSSQTGGAYRILRADDLSPVAQLAAEANLTAPTATGAVGLDISGFPDVQLVVWDFSRGWTETPDPIP